MWGERRTSRARSAAAVLVIIFLIALGGLQGVRAAGPDPWPCLQPGWTAGDQWGPGPDDIVPDAPPCPLETPEASGEPVSAPAARPLLAPIQAPGPASPADPAPLPPVKATLPPTDTDD